MPTLASFNGIVIRMFFRDHNPPHVHVEAGGSRALVAIDDGALLKGALPPSALPQAQAWVVEHRVDLAARWDRYQKGLP